jgi:hypothetical protein
MIRGMESITRNRDKKQPFCGPQHQPCMRWAFLGWILLVCMCVPGYSGQDNLPVSFAVKYASADTVYLSGGSDAGLSVGQKLVIRGNAPDSPEIAQIEIESITSSSAAGKILPGGTKVVPGNIAYLTQEDLDKRKPPDADAAAKKYPQSISFTQGNPLDEEVRESLPRPPLPEVNRSRGRIGFDFGYMQQDGGVSSSLLGITLHLDSSRLGGSYWNLKGYYRGYRHSRDSGQSRPMLVDLVNRTYNLSLTYDNPKSHWVIGAGRLFVPWASSLNTLDGFYLGRRYGKTTFGIFAGSAPDPTSWDYDPHRQMGGGFINFEGGNFDSFRFSSTSGIGLTRVDWHPDRQFGFFQNSVSYKRYLSIYSDMQADLLAPPANSVDVPLPTGGLQTQARREFVLSRSYLTVRIQPLKILSFDISHNYLRNIPTFDERLLSTGLLDQYLFQGLNGGFRLELPLRFGIYSTVGRSSRSGDEKSSWDYLAGVTASDILHTGFRADARYSRFDSSFGRGTYKSLMLAKDLKGNLQFDAQIGQQDVLSKYTSQSRSRFFNGNLNWMVGSRYYLGVGMTMYRGSAENYRQWFATLGYRFDNRRPKPHE